MLTFRFLQLLQFIDCLLSLLGRLAGKRPMPT